VIFSLAPVFGFHQPELSATVLLRPTVLVITTSKILHKNRY